MATQVEIEKRSKEYENDLVEMRESFMKFSLKYHKVITSVIIDRPANGIWAIDVISEMRVKDADIPISSFSG